MWLAGYTIEVSKIIPASHSTLQTYRAVEHALPLVPALLDVTLQRARIQWLQKFKRAQKLARNTHHSAPVVEFTAVLHVVSLLASTTQSGLFCTYIRRREHRHQNPLVEKLIPILDDHVRATH